MITLWWLFFVSFVFVLVDSIFIQIHLARWINTLSGDERGPACQLISTPFTRDPALKKVTPPSGLRPLTTLFQQRRNLKCQLFPPSCSWIGRERRGAVDSSILSNKRQISEFLDTGPTELNPGPPLQSLILGTLRSKDGDGSENVSEKLNSRSFSLHRDYSKSLTLSNVGEPS